METDLSMLDLFGNKNQSFAINYNNIKQINDDSVFTEHVVFGFLFRLIFVHLAKSSSQYPLSNSRPIFIIGQESGIVVLIGAGKIIHIPTNFPNYRNQSMSNHIDSACQLIEKFNFVKKSDDFSATYRLVLMAGNRISANDIKCEPIDFKENVKFINEPVLKKLVELKPPGTKFEEFLKNHLKGNHMYLKPDLVTESISFWQAHQEKTQMTRDGDVKSMFHKSVALTKGMLEKINVNVTNEYYNDQNLYIVYPLNEVYNEYPPILVVFNQNVSFQSNIQLKDELVNKFFPSTTSKNCHFLIYYPAEDKKQLTFKLGNFPINQALVEWLWFFSTQSSNVTEKYIQNKLGAIFIPKIRQFKFTLFSLLGQISALSLQNNVFVEKAISVDRYEENPREVVETSFHLKSFSVDHRHELLINIYQTGKQSSSCYARFNHQNFLVVTVEVAQDSQKAVEPPVDNALFSTSNTIIQTFYNIDIFRQKQANFEENILKTSIYACLLENPALPIVSIYEFKSAIHGVLSTKYIEISDHQSQKHSDDQVMAFTDTEHTVLIMIDFIQYNEALELPNVKSFTEKMSPIRMLQKYAPHLDELYRIHWIFLLSKRTILNIVKRIEIPRTLYSLHKHNTVNCSVALIVNSSIDDATKSFACQASNTLDMILNNTKHSQILVDIYRGFMKIHAPILPIVETLESGGNPTTTFSMADLKLKFVKSASTYYSILETSITKVQLDWSARNPKSQCTPDILHLYSDSKTYCQVDVPEFSINLFEHLETNFGTKKQVVLDLAANLSQNYQLYELSPVNFSILEQEIFSKFHHNVERVIVAQSLHLNPTNVTLLPIISGNMFENKHVAIFCPVDTGTTMVTYAQLVYPMDFKDTFGKTVPCVMVRTFEKNTSSVNDPDPITVWLGNEIFFAFINHQKNILGDNGTHWHFLNNEYVHINIGNMASQIISLCSDHTIGYVQCQNTGHNCVLDLRHYARQDNRYMLIIDCSPDTVFVYKMSMPGQLRLEGLTEIFDRQNMTDLIFVKSASSCKMFHISSKYPHADKVVIGKNFTKNDKLHFRMTGPKNVTNRANQGSFYFRIECSEGSLYFTLAGNFSRNFIVLEECFTRITTIQERQIPGNNLSFPYLDFIICTQYCKKSQLVSIRKHIGTFLELIFEKYSIIFLGPFCIVKTQNITKFSILWESWKLPNYSILKYDYNPIGNLAHFSVIRNNYDRNRNQILLLLLNPLILNIEIQLSNIETHILFTKNNKFVENNRKGNKRICLEKRAENNKTTILHFREFTDKNELFTIDRPLVREIDHRNETVLLLILLKIHITSDNKITSNFELILECLYDQVETFLFLMADYPLRLSFDNKLSSTNLLFKPVPIHFGPESKLIVLFDVFLAPETMVYIDKNVTDEIMALFTRGHLLILDPKSEITVALVDFRRRLSHLRKIRLMFQNCLMKMSDVNFAERSFLCE